MLTIFCHGSQCTVRLNPKTITGHLRFEAPTIKIIGRFKRFKRLYQKCFFVFLQWFLVVNSLFCRNGCYFAPYLLANFTNGLLFLPCLLFTAPPNLNTVSELTNLTWMDLRGIARRGKDWRNPPTTAMPIGVAAAHAVTPNFKNSLLFISTSVI